ncbi:fibrobacter succinogenes major paralogous domain-containing protein [Fibrobacter intestinalis]|uniref:Major paralogous domain-containing protein n=1 Tax=Fibrobacter intestinalis TaxID=28122 RepID=A0A1T4M5M0_9BACT|nr:MULTISPECIES: fibrobacter succinogenes major paralogous domain-containing protein [Fibrobacter]PBC73449.1 uncharacterized protein (TIGR02145 family) [Fibrobacter sp. NR9]SJZ62167.1 major paralogous domain-containing protein [Fibrobacter intestinalis]
MNRHKFKKSVLGLLIMLFLAACGDSGSSVNGGPISAISSNSLLPEVSSSSVEVAPSSSMTEVSSSSMEVVSSSSSSSAISYGTLTDARDGQFYKTVTIGTQTWMAENLNYETANSYCPNAARDLCVKYGRLYLWSTAMDSAGVFSDSGKGCGFGLTCSAKEPVRGVCPEGWHLPSKEEWNTLFAAVGGEYVAGTKLKSKSGWLNDGSTDEYGFSVLPAGSRLGGGDGYHYAGERADFWTSTEVSSDDAYYWEFSSAYGRVFSDYHYHKYSGYSVRCLRDSGAFNDSSAFNQNTEPVSSSSVEAVSSSSIDYGEFTDSRDGQVYKTVKIGEQIWMAENLKYAYLQPTSTEDSSSFCYRNEPDSCAKYGRFYWWSAAMDSAGVFSDGGKGCGYKVKCNATESVRGVCPKGWHLPSNTEWKILFATVGDTSIAGILLKSKSGWYSDGYGMDIYGFSVLPAGYCGGTGHYGNVGKGAYFWSSTEDGSNDAYFWGFDSGYEGVFSGYFDKSLGYSVRCLKDSE